MNKLDLQIGNYINYEQTTHIITELQKDQVIHYWKNTGDGYVSSYESIDPIKINPSEFEKFGFEKKRKSVSLNVGGELFDYWEKISDGKSFIVWVDKETSFFSLKGVLNSQNSGEKYFFVHELQQLYKLLKRKSLEYEK